MDGAHNIEVDDGGSFPCAPERNVLLAMERCGVAAIPIGCRNGGCGFCLVQVTSGKYRTGPMSRRHVSKDSSEAGYALACRVYPDSDLSMRRATQAERLEGSIGPAEPPSGYGNRK